MAISNVIPFQRRAELIKRNAVPGTGHSGEAGELDLALMETRVGAMRFGCSSGASRSRIFPHRR